MGAKAVNSKLDDELSKLNKSSSCDVIDRNNSEQRDNSSNRSETSVPMDREGFPSDQHRVMGRTRTSTTLNYKELSPRKVAEFCATASKIKNDSSVMTPDCNSKYEKIYELSTSSETNTSQRTIFGVTLRHIDEGILD